MSSEQANKHFYEQVNRYAYEEQLKRHWAVVKSKHICKQIESGEKDFCLEEALTLEDDLIRNAAKARFDVLRGSKEENVRIAARARLETLKEFK